MPDSTPYYDHEATAYDATRGGVDRARAAADAILRLAPDRGTCVDVAGGTGIVGAELAARGLDVVVADLSTGMLGVARGRLPGRAVATDATALPFRDAAVDLLTMVWFLHLVPPVVADAAIAEAARVLRPGGTWVTTVDKHRAHGAAPRSDADARHRVVTTAAALGMVESGATSFVGNTDWATAPGAADQVFELVGFRRQ